MKTKPCWRMTNGNGSWRRSLRAILLICLLTPFSATGQGETFSLPLSRTNGWQFLTYRNIPSNVFRTSEKGLEIGVTNSAAPAVFPLPNPLQARELRVTGRITGSLTLPPERQGEKGFDDYTLRVGLVESGTRRLKWREKLVAADWIKKLFALAPPKSGISKIHFFNLGTSSRQIGATRTHPGSELMQETVVAVPDGSGHFSFTNRFARPISTIAIWISSDGDDTESSFAVTLSGIELSTEEGMPAVQRSQ